MTNLNKKSKLRFSRTTWELKFRVNAQQVRGHESHPNVRKSLNRPKKTQLKLKSKKKCKNVGLKLITRPDGWLTHLSKPTSESRLFTLTAEPIQTLQWVVSVTDIICSLTTSTLSVAKILQPSSKSMTKPLKEVSRRARD